MYGRVLVIEKQVMYGRVLVIEKQVMYGRVLVDGIKEGRRY
jgi:hypothetical protein